MPRIVEDLDDKGFRNHYVFESDSCVCEMCNEEVKEYGGVYACKRCFSVVCPDCYFHKFCEKCVFLSGDVKCVVRAVFRKVEGER
jgi:hypothetical protein